MNSDVLKGRVLARLADEVGTYSRTGLAGEIYEVNGWRVNVRIASNKSVNWYWFDFTPSIYFNRLADFALFACGDPRHLYLMPVDDLWHMISDASPGGVKQVPNFTIFADVDELAPAGQGSSRYRIWHLRNNLKPLLQAPSLY